MSVSSGDAAVFRLTVHLHRSLGDAKQLRNAGIQWLVRMTGFHRFAEAGFRERFDLVHLDRLECTVGERSL